VKYGLFPAGSRDVSSTQNVHTGGHTDPYSVRNGVADHAPILQRLTLNLPTTTIVAQPFNVIKWQLKFNPVA